MLKNLICWKMVGRFMNRLCIIWFLWRLFFCVIKWFFFICLTGKSASIKQFFVLVIGFCFIINPIPVHIFCYSILCRFQHKTMNQVPKESNLMTKMKKIKSLKNHSRIIFMLELEGVKRQMHIVLLKGYFFIKKIIIKSC